MVMSILIFGKTALKLSVIILHSIMEVQFRFSI